MSGNVPLTVDGKSLVCAYCHEPIFKNEKFVSGRMMLHPGQDLSPGEKQGVITYYHEEKPECFKACDESRQ